MFTFFLALSTMRHNTSAGQLNRPISARMSSFWHSGLSRTSSRCIGACDNEAHNGSFISHVRSLH